LESSSELYKPHAGKTLYFPPNTGFQVFTRLIYFTEVQKMIQGESSLLKKYQTLSYDGGLVFFVGLNACLTKLGVIHDACPLIARREQNGIKVLEGKWEMIALCPGPENELKITDGERDQVELGLNAIWDDLAGKRKSLRTPLNEARAPLVTRSSSKMVLSKAGHSGEPLREVQQREMGSRTLSDQVGELSEQLSQLQEELNALQKQGKRKPEEEPKDKKAFKRRLTSLESKYDGMSKRVMACEQETKQQSQSVKQMQKQLAQMQNAERRKQSTNRTAQSHQPLDVYPQPMDLAFSYGVHPLAPSLIYSPQPMSLLSSAPSASVLHPSPPPRGDDLVPVMLVPRSQLSPQVPSATR
jgi:hypothetical protein